MAVGDDLGVAVQLAKPVRQLAKRDEPGALDAGDLPFVRLPHVDQDEAVALALAAPLQLFGGDLQARVRGSAPMPQNAS